MRTSQAPNLAIWLLKSLTPKRKSEALIGDLVEEFMRGRSASWCWRQVVAAIIISFIHELRSRLMAAGCAAFWSLVIACMFFGTLPQIQSFSEFVTRWAVRFAFPTSIIYQAILFLTFPWAFETLMASIGIALYLAMIGNFRLRDFLSRSLVASCVFFVGNIGATILTLLALNFFRRFALYAGNAFLGIVLFAGLLLSVWTVDDVGGSAAKRTSM